MNIKKMAKAKDLALGFSEALKEELVSDSNPKTTETKSVTQVEQRKPEQSVRQEAPVKQHRPEESVRQVANPNYPLYPLPTDHQIFIGNDGYDIVHSECEKCLEPILNLFGAGYLDSCYFLPDSPVFVYELIGQDLLKPCETVFKLQRKIKNLAEGILTKHFRSYGYPDSVAPYIAIRVLADRVYIYVARNQLGFATIYNWRKQWKQK